MWYTVHRLPLTVYYLTHRLLTAEGCEPKKKRGRSPAGKLPRTEPAPPTELAFVANNLLAKGSDSQRLRPRVSSAAAGEPVGVTCSLHSNVADRQPFFVVFCNSVKNSKVTMCDVRCEIPRPSSSNLPSHISYPISHIQDLHWLLCPEFALD